MPLLSPVAFPLHAINEGKCGCGHEECTRIGKHPAVLWREIERGSPVPRPVEGAGYGLRTGAAPKGSDVIVVDLDGWEAIDRWEELGGAPETFTVETGREGGVQLYFKHPGFPVKSSRGELSDKIDIRGEGGYVVGPGSPHASGRVYTTIADLEPVPAPAWLLEWLRKQPAPAQVQAHVNDVTDPTERTRRQALYTEYLLTTDPCVEGKGGDERLFQVVQHGAYDLALPTDDVLALIEEHFDPRCLPPWGPELAGRVRHKANSAKTNSTRARVEPLPADVEAWLEAPPKAEFLPTPTEAAKAKRKSAGIFWDDWDEPVDPPTWLIDGLIPISTVGALVAHGSSLKTWTMLSMATAIAKGEDWLGEYRTRKGRVLVVDYESGQYELRRRVRLLEGGRVVGLGAWSYPSGTGSRIDEIDFWRRLAEIPDVAMVCVDSLAAGTSAGVDENSKDAAYPLELAARYAEATDAVVMFIHHSKKDDGGDARKAVRGSTAIFAAMDWCYGFEVLEGSGAAQRMRMACIKPCMGPKPPPVQIELTDEGLGLYEGAPRPDADATDEDIQSRIALTLQAGPVETAEKLAKLCGCRKQRVLDEVKVMLRRKEVILIDDVGYVLDSAEARIERVLACLRSPSVYRTIGQLAREAYATTRFVSGLETTGRIVRSAEGRYIERG